MADETAVLDRLGHELADGLTPSWASPLRAGDRGRPSPRNAPGAGRFDPAPAGRLSWPPY
jgi:hypothetical protein